MLRVSLPLPPKTPQCDKALANRELTLHVSEFLGWLDCQSSMRIEMDAPIGYDELIARFIGVDTKVMETEKREILAYQRLLNAWGAIREDLGLEDSG